MKETVGSLKLYFIIVGVLGGIVNVTSGLAGLSILRVALIATGVALAAGYLYAGIRMADLLATNPGRIQLLVYANMALISVNAAIELSSGYTRGMGQTVIALAVSAYLLFSVRYLSARVVVKDAAVLAAE